MMRKVAGMLWGASYEPKPELQQVACGPHADTVCLIRRSDYRRPLMPPPGNDPRGPRGLPQRRRGIAIDRWGSSSDKSVRQRSVIVQSPDMSFPPSSLLSYGVSSQ